MSQCLLLPITGRWSAAAAGTVPHAAGAGVTTVVMVAKPGKPGAGTAEAGDARGDPEPRLQVDRSPAPSSYASSAPCVCVKYSASWLSTC